MKHAKPRPRWVNFVLRWVPRSAGLGLAVAGAVGAGVGIALGLGDLVIFGICVAVLGLALFNDWRRT